MSLYATDRLAEGTVTHRITEEGLRFESLFHSEAGTANFAVAWPTLELAEKNYENARQSVLTKIPRVIGRLDDLQDGNEVDKSTLRYLLKTQRGDLTLFTNTGPPTWWLPNAGLVRSHGERGVRAGWLRFAFAVSWKAKKTPGEVEPK